MKSYNKKTIKIIIILIITGLIIGGGTALYMFNMPHRDIQDMEADYTLNSSDLVSEYLKNPQTSNEKYLSDDGDSKILLLTGRVAEISEDYKGQKVILLKSDTDKTGVSCTFLGATSDQVSEIVSGSKISVKGVIRSGANFDLDLNMYEPVVMDHCSLIN